MSHRIWLALIVVSLPMAAPSFAHATFSWSNCAGAGAPIQVSSLKVTPDPPETPAPLAITASMDATTGQITNLHGFLLFGGLPFQLDSGPISATVDDEFVTLPATIPMTIAAGGLMAYEAYKLPICFPYKANSYSTPPAGITLVYPDGPSLATVITSGFSTVDITSTNLSGASLGLGFNKMAGFPLPAQTGDYTAEVQLNGSDSKPLGCLSVNLGTGFVECLDSVAASPDILWPPNHRMTPVTISIGTSDDCTVGSCTITSVSSNEPPGSDSVASGDAVITGDLTLNLRAERGGTNESGRAYTVTLKCQNADSCNGGGPGDYSTKTVSVLVPHNMGQ